MAALAWSSVRSSAWVAPRLGPWRCSYGASSAAGPSTWVEQRRQKRTVAAPASPRKAAPPPLDPAVSDYLSSIRPKEVSRSRYDAHYHDTLSTDLLYMTYDHSYVLNPPSPPKQPERDHTNPYAINRARPRPRGGLALRPNAGAVSPDNLVQLIKVVLSTHVKGASSNKALLLSPLMAFQTIAGLPDVNIPNLDVETGPHLTRKDPQGVRVVHSRPPAQTFRTREGQPVGVKAVMTGERAYAFIETLVEFVFPRLKDWPGVSIGPVTGGKRGGDSGTVEFGLPERSLQLFPQIEANYEQYPGNFGFNVQLVTNARGHGARNRARALASGLGIPFVVGAK